MLELEMWIPRDRSPAVRQTGKVTIKPQIKIMRINPINSLRGFRQASRYGGFRVGITREDKFGLGDKVRMTLPS